MSYKISISRKPLEPRETIEDDDCLIREWEGDWSEWVAIMSPTKVNAYWEKRDGRGYRLNPRLVSNIFVSEGGRTCGIYEFIALKGETKTFVVYVGSSCRFRGKSLPDRINEYCADGSHKANLINDALKKGYTLGFRYKVARNEEKAENDENRLLAMYSYAWNVRTVTGTLPH